MIKIALILGIAYAVSFTLLWTIFLYFKNQQSNNKNNGTKEK